MAMKTTAKAKKNMAAKTKTKADTEATMNSDTDTKLDTTSKKKKKKTTTNPTTAAHDLMRSHLRRPTLSLSTPLIPLGSIPLSQSCAPQSAAATQRTWQPPYRP
ncbi:hypothetical protein P171DRAFT_482642 [Karstenula rhodostoma CBS 690.94]|uniref:Uncharacterized protein n=1 Tax=Karstenula rhodostoma CBS 690.94 TaxID=1392251 RepID=A0A9P4PPU5_9PLEO|nr:hypothetical protein P171DRAFT_482642 [Karstenula rhodostoma CBS 690.94]